ncbi:unnamed protein product [Ilex paraguariensis]|uniref:Uncharacterized protein n=1 Tax=Ilex paraguariensis TaxID=185542 RepID=A0ABC8SZX0_9AQUA
MASTSPLGIIEEDDEFDWEAAVEEIDVACQTTTEPSTQHLIDTHQLSIKTLYSNTHEKPKSSRQTTIDKFIGCEGSSSIPQPGNWNVRNDNEENVDGDEMVRCDKTDAGAANVNIDAEAAKIWIYPGFI